VNGARRAEAPGTPFWTGPLEYHLPEHLIAQHPARERAASRLMVAGRAGGDLVHATFADIGEYLPAGALLVANDSKVFAARLRGNKRGSGGAVEALLLGMGEGSVAPAMVRVAKALHEGQVVEFGGDVNARVAAPPVHGRVMLDFSPLRVEEAVAARGEIPLPPYITRREGPTSEDVERYQTVYARDPGSVAAPTAGLHFTGELLASLEKGGFEFATVTLHVGPGTFTPVRGDLDMHEMEEEHYEVPSVTIERIESARRAGRPIVAVGTTTVRALESAADEHGCLTAGPRASRLFIRPGYRFRVVDALVTNFHLPGSTLLALVMALAGRERIEAAYETAVREGYRFYSYGDAMLVR
jgi:S-adenosylmethionine:tRNA ribosyltransferase-isomerase